MGEIKMKIGIVGSNSNIARSFVSYLSDKNVSLFLYDVHDYSLDGYDTYNKISFDDDSYKMINLECDLLYVFFGLIGTIKGFDSYDSFIKVNELYLVKLLDLISSKKAKTKIVYISSRLVYADFPKLHSENDTLNGKSVYAINKIAAENFIRIYSDCYGIKYTIFRLGIPFGAVNDVSSKFGIVSIFEEQAKTGEIKLFWGGEGTRTFTHIFDICNVMFNVASTMESDNEIYNVGGVNHSLYEVAYYYAKKYDSKIVFIEKDGLENSVDVKNGAFDFSKIQKFFPYRYIDLVNEK